MLSDRLDLKSTWSFIVRWSGCNVYTHLCCNLLIHASSCGPCRQEGQPNFSEVRDLEASLQLHALRQSLQTRPTSPQHLLMEQAGLKVRPCGVDVRLLAQLWHDLSIVHFQKELGGC